MNLLLAALAVLTAGGVLAALCGRRSSWAAALGAGGAMLGGVTGAAGALAGLGRTMPEIIDGGAQLLWGHAVLYLDPLAALFALPVCGLGALTALYGVGYLRHHHAHYHGAVWLWFNLLIAAMLTVFLARDSFLFLTAWEVMTVTSFLLVMSGGERGAWRAGWTYLIATHIGTAFLIAMFLLLGDGQTGFSSFAAGDRAGLLFVFALVGFGTKAGLLPVHVWLPEAHPAAPSHVSALMSGVMIKTGIYGLLRLLTFLGTPAGWWGWLLIGLGLATGLYGIVQALAQHDLKRLLAYSSVENVGIITLALGLGVLGWSTGNTAVMALGLAGALLHTLNHALFKGLLFLGAGVIAQATGTRDLDRMGGLLKRMPWTGTCVLIGAAAIAGLPPFNGFAGEFLIYFAALLRGGTTGAVAIAGLALIGGLAAAAFAQLFGIVFLGEARSSEARDALDAGFALRLPLAVLAAGCVLVGLAGPLTLWLMVPVITTVTGTAPHLLFPVLAAPSSSLTMIVLAIAGLMLLAGALAWCVRRLLARRAVRVGLTWDCGYARPDARMQYTASSFAQPLTALFAGLVRLRRRGNDPAGLFPATASLATEPHDPCRDGLFVPLFGWVARGMAWLFWVQQGRVQYYILYIVVTLGVLLLWKL